MKRNLVFAFAFFAVILLSLSMVSAFWPFTGNAVKNNQKMSNGKYCEDSDGGIFADERGKVTVTKSLFKKTKLVIYSDVCTGASRKYKEAGENGDIVKRKAFVEEYYCNEKGNGAKHVKVACENGCFEGACVSNEPATCTDSDGGVAPKTYGWTDFKSGSFELRNKDFCVLVQQYDSDGSPGGRESIESCTGDNCYVEEAYCKTDENGNFVDADATQVIKCGNGCENGACRPENKTNQCIDSDGGRYY